jgi:hypothetical protein
MTEVFCFVVVDEGSRHVEVYGPSDATGTLPNGTTAWEGWLTSSNMKNVLFMNSSTNEDFFSIEIPIANRAAPAIGVAVLHSTAGLNRHEMIVRGYSDPWVPKV